MINCEDCKKPVPVNSDYRFGHDGTGHNGWQRSELPGPDGNYLYWHTECYLNTAVVVHMAV